MSPPPPRERPVHPVAVPAEGSDGLFTQSWFPVCLASQVPAGTVIQRDFLDGQVAVFRGADGVPRVFSAYCLHLGANLAAGGKVVGNDLRCPFHHWQYDGTGQCVRTGVGDKAPARARLFAFPTVESCGVIFAFNGETPLYPFPDLLAGSGYGPEDLIITAHEDPRCPWPVDPWAIRANTPDWSHFAFVHNMRIDEAEIPDPRTTYTWSPYWVNFDAKVNLAHGAGAKLTYKVQITGTSLWHNHGTFNGRWHMMMSALGIPKPGTSCHFYVFAVHKGDGSTEQAAEALSFHDELRGMWERMLDEDDPILKMQHYRPGLLTQADAALSRFLQYVKEYPRAHPSREFLR